MSDEIDKLRMALGELQQELETVETLDTETASALEQAIHEIHSALHPDEAASLQSDTLIQRLQDATESFESSHPSLTSIVTRIVDGLGQMGI